MSASRVHRREYAMEGALRALFMITTCGLATLLEHPDSPVRRALPDGDVRRLLMGLGMGVTAMGLICSPWGQQSGAHMNPSLTITYLRLGKIDRGDALGHVAGQFLGGVAGVLAMRTLLGMLVAHPAVRFVATAPGRLGPAAAFAAELGISFLLMTVVLAAWHWTALWIYFVAPPLRMLAAAEAYVRVRGAHRVRCAKLSHRTARRCIFRCDYA